MGVLQISRQDKRRQCFIWSLIQSYAHRLYPNNLSSKLTTEEFSTPVRKNIGNLILFSSEGWDPPTTAEEEVKVHSHSEIFSGVNDPVSAKKCRMNAAEKEGEGNIFCYLFILSH